MTTETTDCVAMSATTDAHRKFAPFVGTFRAEVRMWMGPGDPMVSTGTMTNTLRFGGRFLEQDYKGDPNDGPFPSFEGHGYWGYNKTDERYEGVWIDNASTIIQTDQGQLDSSGKVWTMLSQMTCPTARKPMQKRTVITLKDNDHHTMEMFFKAAGENEAKAMEINYVRDAP